MLALQPGQSHLYNSKFLVRSSIFVFFPVLGVPYHTDVYYFEHILSARNRLC